MLDTARLLSRQLQLQTSALSMTAQKWISSLKSVTSVPGETQLLGEGHGLLPVPSQSWCGTGHVLFSQASPDQSVCGFPVL